MTDAQSPEAAARHAQGEEVKRRRRALGWSRGDLAARAALDPRIIQLVELGEWTEGEAIGRVRAVLIRAEGGDLDVQLPPVEAPTAPGS